MAKRPLNVCGECGHRWRPRSNFVSARCPACGSGRVGVSWLPLVFAAIFLLPVLIAGASFLLCCGLGGLGTKPASPADPGGEALAVGKTVTLTGALVTGSGGDPKDLFEGNPDPAGAFDLRWRGWDVLAQFRKLSAMKGADHGDEVAVRGRVAGASAATSQLFLQDAEVLSVRKRR